MVNRETLLQEKYMSADPEFGPWKVLLVCQALNRTTWIQAEPVLDKIFERWTTPKAFGFMSDSDQVDLAVILKPLGMVSTRAFRMLFMSKQFATVYDVIGPDWRRYCTLEFKGCGEYSADAWSLFVLKRKCTPGDIQLRKHAVKVGLYGNP